MSTAAEDLEAASKTLAQSLVEDAKGNRAVTARLMVERAQVQVLMAMAKASQESATATAGFTQQLTDLRDRLTAAEERAGKLEARAPYGRLGRVSVGALLLGASTSVPVTWSSPFPTADYKVDVLAPSLLGKATVTLTDQTPAGLTVVVKSTLATVATTVDLLAYTIR